MAQWINQFAQFSQLHCKVWAAVGSQSREAPGSKPLVLLASVAGAILLLNSAAQAQPADIFKPHLNAMVQSMPPGFAIRLPQEVFTQGNYILLNGRDGVDEGPLQVQVYASQTPLSLVVSLYECDPATTPRPCLFGTVTNDRSSAPHARTELERHRRLGDPVTFGRGLRGYLLDGSRAGTRSRFSSISWQQDSMIYTLSFPATGDRQDLIKMAGSMAYSSPVRPSLPPAIPASTVPLRNSGR